MPCESVKNVGKHTSIWLGTTQPTNYPSLDCDIDTDILVIGAGIAGITTAYLLSLEFDNVVLIDSGRIAGGVTARTTAKINALGDLMYQRLIGEFDADFANKYADANLAAIEFIDEIVKKNHIICEFSRQPMFVYTETDDGLDKIQKEVDAASKAGLPATFEEKSDLPFKIAGALKLDNQAQFHPVKYLQALANLFVKNGGIIYENTLASKIETGELVTTITDKGVIKSQRAVLTTHYPFYDKPGLYYLRMTPYRDHALAVKTKNKPPEGMYIDVSGNYFSVRSYEEYAVVGGISHRVGEQIDTVQPYNELVDFAQKHFEVDEISYGWSTQDNYTVDHVPFIGRIGGNKSKIDNIYVATGFSGWGMTNGTLSGMLIRDLILGRVNTWNAIFDPERGKLSLRDIGKETKQQAPAVIKGLIAKRLSAGEVEDVLEINKCEGRIVRKGGHKLAVYRDENGNLHTFSAICSHMGCIVTWNQAEMSWDCPCHGSRYSVDGQVIHGPAVKGLGRL